MSTLSTHAQPTSILGWFHRAEAWLDDKGKGAWIVALVLSFILFWPIGLALLAYVIGSKKMTCHAATRYPRSRFHAATLPSGNRAFDAYREDTLRRLQEEQQNFEAFLDRLRAARDKAEFDQFMEERAKAARAAAEDDNKDEDTTK